MSGIQFELLEDKIWYKDNYKYQLDVSTRMRIDLKLLKPITVRFIKYEKGILTILPGYAWNGASGPAVDTKSFMRGSLFHDCLYQLMEEGFLDWSYKGLADEVLVGVCKIDKMAYLRRLYVYQAVDKLGKFWVRTQAAGVLSAP